MPADAFEQPSIAVPAPVLHSPNPPPVCSPTETMVVGDSCNNAYNHRPQSVGNNSNLSALPQRKLGLSHRRANTEIVPRRTPPLSGQEQVNFAAGPGDNCRFSQPASEGNTKRRFGESARFVADWFQGKSEPVNFSAIRQSTSQEADDEMASSDLDDHIPVRRGSVSSLPAVSGNKLQKRQTAPSPLKQVTTANRFSFFGLKRQDQGRPELPEPADDDLLNLDVAAVLSPPGSNDMRSDEALDAVRCSAGSVIKQLQAAYKQRTFALHASLAEKNEVQEEIEESRTRAEHLKTQLDGMAEKVMQQEKEMNAMAEELEQERQTRRKEEEARKRSVTLIKTTSTDSDSVSDMSTDLQAPKQNVKRSSNCTFASDSGFESGDESIAESVFSRRETLESPVSLTLSSPNVPQATPPAPPPKDPKIVVRPARTPAPAPATAAARPSAYDRVMKGLASSSLANSLMKNSSKCTICYGVPASEAWTVLGILKEENHGLKDRLVELEGAVDYCLCVIGP